MSALACVAPAELYLRTAADVRAFFAVLARDRYERCGFAYFSPQWMLLGVREGSAGSAVSADVPLRDVVGDVLRLDARAVVMVHNHPVGDLTPSAADVAVTRRVIAALDAIDVSLVDHVVLGRDGHASMRDLGLL